jgi:hypothetical protein
MSSKFLIFSLFLLIVLSFGACYQSDPPSVGSGPEPKGDLYFSGYSWNLKSSNTSVGPGPNIFSNSSNNIWKDAQERLHLKIRKENNTWTCSELISTRTFGYGTYIFTTDSDLTTFNEKIVFGLFTWNNYSFQTQGNSEVDIEFAKWNDASDSLVLTYSVQPVWFDTPSPYQERTRKPQMQVSKLKGTCTHVFKWTPDLITWESYEGENYPGINLIASWSYNKNNVPRTKVEGGKNSAPIVIPAPEDSTNARFNLWLLNGQAPSDGNEVEVVLKSFKFIPM